MLSTAPSVPACVPDGLSARLSLSSSRETDRGPGGPSQGDCLVVSRAPGAAQTRPRRLTHSLFLFFAHFLENDTDVIPVNVSSPNSCISFRHLDLHFHVVKMMMMMTVNFKIIVVIDEVSLIWDLTSTTTTTKLVWGLGV